MTLNVQDKVIFFGETNQNDIAAALRKVKVLLIPSRWSEPFGIVALEGLASGCTVIASERGGLKEATGGFATLLSPDDTKSWTSEVEKALFSPVNRSVELRNFLEDHVPSVVVEKYNRVFQDFYSLNPRTFKV